MADIKFSELPAAIFADLTATDILPMSDLDVAPALQSKKVTFALLKQFMFAAAVFTTSFTSLAGKIGLGTTPGTTGAINVDAASYATVAATFNSGATLIGSIFASGGNFTISAAASTQLRLFSNALSKFEIISESAGMATLKSAEVTFRIVGGSTNGVSFRGSGNTADRFSFNDLGTAFSMADGTRVFQVTNGAAAGGILAGSHVFTNNLDLGLLTAGNATGAGTVSIYYGDNTTFQTALTIAKVTGFGTLQLMPAGGNVVIGGTAAGATASGVLAFGTTAATEPTATVDLVQLYGFDFGAGQRALGVWQEYAPYAGVAVASTHRWPVRINGVAYYVLVTTVA